MILYVLVLSFGGSGGNRTRVRQYAIFGSTCVVLSIDLTFKDPTDRVLKAILWSLTVKLKANSSAIL
jgi:hypothetical protein